MATPIQSTMFGLLREYNIDASSQKSSTLSGVSSIQNNIFIAISWFLYFPLYTLAAPPATNELYIQRYILLKISYLVDKLWKGEYTLRPLQSCRTGQWEQFDFQEQKECQQPHKLYFSRNYPTILPMVDSNL